MTFATTFGQRGPLRTATPHPPTDAISGHPVANLIDDAGTIAVWNDAREWHAVAEGILPFLDIAGSRVAQM